MSRVNKVITREQLSLFDVRKVSSKYIIGAHIRSINPNRPLCHPVRLPWVSPSRVKLTQLVRGFLCWGLLDLELDLDLDLGLAAFTSQLDVPMSSCQLD